MHRVDDSFVFTDEDEGELMAGATWRELDSAKEKYWKEGTWEAT